MLSLFKQPTVHRDGSSTLILCALLIVMATAMPAIGLITPDRYELDNVGGSAGWIYPAETQHRNIHAPGNKDWAKFKLTAPRTMTIQTAGTTGDTVLRLYGPDSSTTQIAFNDDAGTGLFSRVTQTLSPGTYYIKVNDYGNDDTIGSYTLWLSPVPDVYELDNAPGSAKWLLNRRTQTRSIHAAGNQDWAKFTVTDYRFVALQTAGPDREWPQDDTYMYLYGPNNAATLIESNDDGGTVFYSRIARRLMPGRYYVMVRGFSATTPVPRYTLRMTQGRVLAAADAFEVDNAPGTAKWIYPGVPQQRSIHGKVNKDWAKFTVPAGGRTVTIRTSGPNNTDDTVMWLYGPGSYSTLKAYNDDADGGLWSRITMFLSPGTYFIKVAEYGLDATIVNYTLQLSM